MEAFSGVIVLAKTGLLYKMGLAVVAFAMVLLPAIYVGLIVLAAWGVFNHLTKNAWLIGLGGGFYGPIIDLGLAVVGGILVFFMGKPLYAPKQKGVQPVTLDPAKELLLFAFMEKICALVKACTR